ncbi:MAG: hypothetical protein JO250_11430 [Armatimonadetes bacterium]|nr:hypothetical protein [Armatimonadota bacterium]
MIQTIRTRRPPRLLAWALTALMAGPLLIGLTGCGHNDSGATDQTTSGTAPNAGAPTTAAPPAPAKPGMSTGKKVVIALAGAALLYYLYKKHQAAQQAQGGQAQAGGQPQLYRSRNGGVYYRDAQHRPVWLTVPNQPVQVPAEDVQRYAPDYQQYQGQAAPPAPSGYTQQPFTQYDPSLAGSAGM